MLFTSHSNAIVLTGLWLALGGLAIKTPFVALPALSSTPAQVSRIQCPRDISVLVNRLLADLPSYMNRVRTRAGITNSFVVLAARPNLQSLPLPSNSDVNPTTQQVFFTVLQRRYERNQILYLQEYDWLFVTQTAQNWQFVMLYSTFGPYPANPAQPPLPPYLNNDGNAAVAIQDWLSDCRAGQLIQPSILRFVPKLPARLDTQT